MLLNKYNECMAFPCNVPMCQNTYQTNFCWSCWIIRISLLDWKIRKTIRLLNNGLRTETVGLQNIRLNRKVLVARISDLTEKSIGYQNIRLNRKKYWLPAQQTYRLQNVPPRDEVLLDQQRDVFCQFEARFP